MLRKLIKFLSKCNNFVNVYSSKINEIDENVKSLNTNYIQVEKEIKTIKDDVTNLKMIQLNEKIENLNAKLNCIASFFDCANLEYLNLNYNINKNKVLIVGFYGAPNLGDELMLYSILNKFSFYENDLDITVMMSENYEFDITKYKKCKVIHYPKNIIDINTLANYYDTVIFGGGALLDDNDYNLNNKFTLSTTLINLAHRMITCRKKVILYGLSSNFELNNKEFITKLNYIINNADYVSLRDTNSLEVLRKCDINTKNIKIVHDLVFTYNYLKYTNNRNSNLVKKIGLIFVCNEDNIKILCDLTDQIKRYFYNNEQKYKILMIPFYEYKNNDTNYYKKLIDSVNVENAEILEYPDPVDNVFEIISNLDICISMRYHGTLISNVLGIPTLNLLYDCHRNYKNKVDYLYNNYNFNNFQINFSEINEDVFGKTLDNLCKISKKNKNDKTVYDEANKQIDDVIKKIIVKEKEVLE